MLVTTTVEVRPLMLSPEQTGPDEEGGIEKRSFSQNLLSPQVSTVTPLMQVFVSVSKRCSNISALLVTGWYWGAVWGTIGDGTTTTINRCVLQLVNVSW